MKQKKKVELLAPAGSREKLEIAIHYGADAVYVGGKQFSLRNFSGNFTTDQLDEAVHHAREKNVKIYVAVNIYPHDDEMDQLRRYLKKLGEIRPDAVIVADPGVFTLARNVVPHLALHISTQANTTHSLSAQFWRRMGARRVNLARELSLARIERIAHNCDIEIEAFVHGAMCISYSGRCLLSGFMAGRQSNRGMCCHPCRWNYAVMEQTRPGQYFPVAEDGRGTYIFNSRDLCMIDHIDAMVEAGIDSLKIEGRMKGINYLATTVRTYREAIDSYCLDPENYRPKLSWKQELLKVTHRNFSRGFYFDDPADISAFTECDKTVNKQLFIGKVIRNEKERGVLVDIRNKVLVNESVEIFSAKGVPQKSAITAIFSRDNRPLPHAQPGTQVYLNIDSPCSKNDLIRRL